MAINPVGGITTSTASGTSLTVNYAPILGKTVVMSFVAASNSGPNMTPGCNVAWRYR